MPMELTRRDAVAALATLGIGSAAIGRTHGTPMEVDAVTAVLLAMTDLVYPSDVEVDDAFIETYVLGGFRARPEYRRQVTEAIGRLDRTARRQYGQPFDGLPIERRRGVLRHLGVHRVHSNPAGTTAEQIRYYVVDDLLYALFTTPVGGALLGLENPPGYPGGTQAYQGGPPE